MIEFIKGVALGAIVFGIPLLVWVYKPVLQLFNLN